MAKDIEKDRILSWRITMFEEMGFTAEQAELLASAPAEGVLRDGRYLSTHVVRRMVKNGCSHDLTIKIVL